MYRYFNGEKTWVWIHFEAISNMDSWPFQLYIRDISLTVGGAAAMLGPPPFLVGSPNSRYPKWGDQNIHFEREWDFD